MRPYAGRARPVIRDPVIEPFWTGLRVLAHVGPSPDAGPEPTVRLRADGSVDLGTDLPEIVAHVSAAVQAIDAVVDGVVTRQIGLRSEGAAPITEVRSSASTLIMRNNAEIDVVPRGVSTEDDEAEEGFVAVDLL